MGFLKKLKRRISLKNVLSGVKKGADFLPGGQLIKDGVSQLERAVATAKGKSTPTTVGTISQTEAAREESKKTNQMGLWLIAGAVVLLWLVSKRRKGS